MAELAVTAIGADRPGVVAILSGVLHERGGNILDSSMTILGGHFTMMLLVDIDERPEQLHDELRDATAHLALFVAVTPVSPSTRPPQPTHFLSVYGADRPGVLAGVTRTLADHGVNITDLTTRMLSPDDQPVYAMVFNLEFPPGLDADVLDAAVRATSERLGVDHTLRPLEVETY